MCHICVKIPDPLDLHILWGLGTQIWMLSNTPITSPVSGLLLVTLRVYLLLSELFLVSSASSRQLAPGMSCSFSDCSLKKQYQWRLSTHSQIDISKSQFFCSQYVSIKCFNLRVCWLDGYNARKQRTTITIHILGDS